MHTTSLLLAPSDSDVITNDARISCQPEATRPVRHAAARSGGRAVAGDLGVADAFVHGGFSVVDISLRVWMSSLRVGVGEVFLDRCYRQEQ
jgi:hypothetical protein